MGGRDRKGGRREESIPATGGAARIYGYSGEFSDRIAMSLYLCLCLSLDMLAEALLTGFRQNERNSRIGFDIKMSHKSRDRLVWVVLPLL